MASALEESQKRMNLAARAARFSMWIAADLGVVEQTVKFHRARIMERMQAKTIAELMHIAGRLGIDAATPAAAPAGSFPGPAQNSRKPGPAMGH